ATVELARSDEVSNRFTGASARQQLLVHRPARGLDDQLGIGRELGAIDAKRVAHEQLHFAPRVVQLDREGSGKPLGVFDQDFAWAVHLPTIRWNNRGRQAPVS